MGKADSLARFFSRPFFLSLTIGLPFCIFKLLFGLSAIRAGGGDRPLLALFGAGVLLWAGVDMMMNAGRALLDLLGRGAPFEYCSIAQMGRLVGMPTVFLAFDTLLSFSIICIMLWSGWIAALTPWESVVWSGATTLNLISLSIVMLLTEIRRV
ncbi:hypothetical protein [Methanofollis fontis]|uniref:Uncharacterized protein n=1 Tax=Methanofollis fontis TaxID=2052832 RepID=A0A483CPZ4_9EURY|nr:hypothetical protein [Methanofollis fontis]TAJ45193.1 hypothetical protein CUJ86_00095 [Methanofollis fontis]